MTTDPYEQLEHELGQHGWTVTFVARGDEFPDNRVIRLAHALTAERSYVLLPGDDLGAVVRKILAHPEMKRIATCPPDLPNGVLLGRLRAVAEGRHWDRVDLASIAAVLQSVGVLTNEEESWLQDAGPAWSEEADES